MRGIGWGGVERYVSSYYRLEHVDGQRIRSSRAVHLLMSMMQVAEGPRSRCAGTGFLCGPELRVE